MQFVLEEHHRNVSTDELIADVRRVADELGKKSITIEEYEGLGKYHHTTIRRRIGSWKEILLQANLSVEGHNFYISDEEYLADLKFVAETLQKDTVTSSEYKLYGKYGSSKLSKRFGNWKRALEMAGLKSTGYNNVVSDIELLEEIERIWIKLGRQPTTTDIKARESKYGLNTYSRHFGSWRKALEAFIQYINDDVNSEESDLNMSSKENNEQENGTKEYRHKTKRDVNLRLRFLVMKRDNFKCCMCGASPAKNPEVVLHMDHIVPWSKGGETTMENLQTLCSDCNFGKSDLV